MAALFFADDMLLKKYLRGNFFSVPNRGECPQMDYCVLCPIGTNRVGTVDAIPASFREFLQFIAKLRAHTMPRAGFLPFGALAGIGAALTASANALPSSDRIDFS